MNAADQNATPETDNGAAPRDVKRRTAQIVAANLAPLLGVVLLNWSMLEIFLIYWVESAFLGLLAVTTLYRMHRRRGQTGAVLLSSGALFMLASYTAAVYVMFVIMARDSAVFWSPDSPDLTPDQVMTSVWFIGVGAVLIGSGLYGYLTTPIHRQYAGRFPPMVRPLGRLTAILVAVMAGYVLQYVIPTATGTLFVLIAAKCVGEWWVLTKRPL